MLLTKIFLTLVGLAYLVLAAWCTLRPAETASKVGYELRPGAGQSEFLTVYGGLELALGIALLLPLVRDDTLPFALLLCLIVHACLVAFRSAGFLLFPGIPRGTYVLAAVEWAIFLGAAWRFFFGPK